MNGKLKIRHISTLEDFKNLQEPWAKLLAANKNDTAFLTWEWLYAWWIHHQENKTLWLITAWESNELIGIAPLMLVKARKYGLPFRLLQTLGTPNTDESTFIVLNKNQEIVIQLFNYITTQKNKWDALAFNEFESENQNTKTILENLSNTKLRTTANINIHQHIEIKNSWEGYYKSLSKSTRKDLERTLRHAEEAYKITFCNFRGSDLRWEHFETIFEINKNGQFPTKYETSQERDFQRELFLIANQKNWVEISILYF